MGVSLTPFWDCLNFISHAFVSFIGSFKLFRDKVRHAFHLPSFDRIACDLTDELTWFFSPCCCGGVFAILEVVVHVSERFMFALGSL